ncbi:MAG: hypothetical protein GPOALKHO_000781 [Sodalis sp.]|nr:MAG: hypothetical protein GPOALKHO_000781 [Sodalis sp.]
MPAPQPRNSKSDRAGCQRWRQGRRCGVSQSALISGGATERVAIRFAQQHHQVQQRHR